MTGDSSCFLKTDAGFHLDNPSAGMAQARFTGCRWGGSHKTEIIKINIKEKSL
jgi:hypothetical protein